MFHRFVDEESFFVSTLNTRPAGLETAFSVQLADGSPVLRGQCIVLQSWAGANSPFKTPGVRLGILRLTASSMHVFEQLLITRSAPTPPSLPPPPASSPSTHLDDAATKLAKAPDLRRPSSQTIPDPRPADAKPDEQRTPGSDLILPANPLSGILDVALEGFVDCTLYEETGNFFPVDEELAPPPKRTTIPPPMSNMSIVNGPMEMSVLAPLPGGTLSSSSMSMSSSTMPPPMMVTSSTMPPPMGSPSSTMPPPMMLVSPMPPPIPGVPSSYGPSGGAMPPPIPGMARGTPMPPMSNGSTTPMPFAGMPNSDNRSNGSTIPPPMAPMPMAPMADSHEGTQSTRTLRLPPRRYLLAAGFTVIGIATVAIAASRDSKPASKPPEKVVAQLETPKPMHEVAEQPSPPPAQPAAPTTPAATDNEDEATESNDAPAIIGDGPCKLEVATTPAGSMISLDDKVLAPSPLTLATTCEKHKLDIAHARYVTSTKFVSLTKPDDKFDISLGRPTHTVSITSQPTGATIFIDGHRAGTTPTTLSVIGFQQVKLEVKKTGYQPMTTKIYSKVPQDKVSLRLTKW